MSWMRTVQSVSGVLRTSLSLPTRRRHGRLSTLLTVYGQIPASYICRTASSVYRALLTLPVTTASVERGFSKLTLVKSKLRSTMTEGRLEALLIAAVERVLLIGL